MKQMPKMRRLCVRPHPRISKTCDSGCQDRRVRPDGSKSLQGQLSQLPATADMAHVDQLREHVKMQQRRGKRKELGAE